MFLTLPDTSYACPSRQDNTFFIGIIFLLGIIGVTAYGIYHPPIFVAVGVMFFFLSFSGLCGLGDDVSSEKFSCLRGFPACCGADKITLLFFECQGQV